MSIEIRDVRAICTAPEGINLVAVKIETNEPELYGVGCATFATRLAEQNFTEDSGTSIFGVHHALFPHAGRSERQSSRCVGRRKNKRLHADSKKLHEPKQQKSRKASNFSAGGMS